MLAWGRMIAWAIFDSLFYFSMRRPRLLRVGMGFFRRVWPIFEGPFASLGGTMFLVTRAVDVHEVLRRTTDFLLGPVNQKKILQGDFIISLDPEHKYHDEKKLIGHSLPDNRLAEIERIVDSRADELLYKPESPFEVAEFAERITVAIVEHFWGLDPAGAQSKVVCAEPGRETMRLWLRKLAIVLGSREPAPFGIREIGLACNEEFLSFVEAQCTTHSPDARDMIGYMLKRSGGNVPVVSRNAAALMMTGSAVVTKAFCHAFDQILRRPRVLKDAIDIAKAPILDRPAMGYLLVEGLRFNPVFPVLPRYCVRNTTLAQGTPRATEIPAGSNVIASVLGAMFDPEAVDQPDRFSNARNLQLNRNFAADNWRYGSKRDGTPGDYMIFGGGDHWCLGDQMAIGEMASMAIALLGKLNNPRRPCYSSLRYDGSAVRSLRVWHG